MHLSAGGFAVDGREAASRILEAAGTHKPAVIYMTGDLVENSGYNANGGTPLFLQKPFRVSDVLAILRDVMSATPAEGPRT